uniref:CRAL-TRIO domain-containing protein n=1 Tax=Timema shepardi TaxID=629360 RepID=A0A7R9G2U4_TIMSH|nr:unnamed protein product [Timema shepardi]
MASLVFTDSSQLTSDSQHLEEGRNEPLHNRRGIPEKPEVETGRCTLLARLAIQATPLARRAWMELAKSVIENHYTIKTHATELWGNRDPLSREIQDALDVTYMVLLPERDRSGNLVLLFRMANYEPSKFIQERAGKAFLMLNDVALLEHGTVPGLTLVLDSKGVGFNFLPRLANALLVLSSTAEDGEIEVRISIVIHSSGLEDFYKIVPNEILPKEYGGEAGPIEEAHKRSYEKMKQHRNWFIEEEKLRVDESKRLGKAKSASEVFGLEGSFKKLDID